MRIISYQCTDVDSGGWSFSPVELEKINLIVGDTGSGKTRFLNTIFNLGTTVTGAHKLYGPTKWKLHFTHLGHAYKWHIETFRLPNGRIAVKNERLLQLANSSFKTIIKRTQSSFIFQSKPIPMLSSDNTSINLLKEETSIRPIYEGFSMILRREFFSDALAALIPVMISDPKTFQTPPKSPNDLSILNLPVNHRLYIIYKHFPALFSQFCDYYTSFFPFVKTVDMKDIRELHVGLGTPNPTPVFAIKERNVRNWIGAGQLSSGMQKVLLILTDAFTLPKESIYLIDEYENSLGVTAIDFFPNFLATYENDIQFIVTSHHPYLINNISPKNWFIFHRKGSRVKIRYGPQNIEIYGKSKQQQFIQLLNDPFYSEGIE